MDLIDSKTFSISLAGTTLVRSPELRIRNENLD